MTTRFADHLLTGNHASRPTATTVPEGTLYSCTTHSLIYQSDGATWSTYATLGGTETLPVSIIDAKGDLIAGSAADTAGRLAVGSNDQVLVADSGQSLGVKWAAVPGTSAFVPVSTIDAKGDLLVGSANDAIDNLAVGSDGQVLTADSAQTLGVKWATAGGGGAISQLFDSQLGSNAANIDTGAGGIATTANHLLVIMRLRTNTAATTFDDTELTFNNDTGANYSWQRLRALNTTVSGVGLASQNFIQMPAFGASAGSNKFTTVRFVLANYATTDQHKTFECTLAEVDADTSKMLVQHLGGMWASTSAISRMNIAAGGAANLITGSRVTVYGLT